MAKYKVKVIMISLKKNKKAKFGDIVNRGQLAGDPETLINGGYIEECTPGGGQSELKRMTVAELTEFAAEKGFEVDLEQNKPALLASILQALQQSELAEMTAEQLTEFAAENELDVDTEQDKPELLASILQALNSAE